MIVAVWDCKAFVPVTVTVYVPRAVELVGETIRVVVAHPPAERGRLLLRESPRPVGDDETERVTVPPKLSTLPNWIVEALDCARMTDRMVGIAAMV